MSRIEPKRIAAITTIRGEDFFIKKWVEYYGAQLGRKNLYVFVDGHDQSIPDGLDGVNFIYIPHIFVPTVAFEKRRARIISSLGAALFELHDIVLALDCDEFILPDPKLNVGLKEYLVHCDEKVSLSPIGVDLRHNFETELEFDYSLPILGQRRFAAVDAHYTKPSIAFQPLRWKSGMHRIHKKRFNIADDLYLFHIGLFDLPFVEKRISAFGELNADWVKHFESRKKLMRAVVELPARDGDVVFGEARKHFTTKRRLIHPNKPKGVFKDHVLTIPERFFGTI